MMMAQEQYHIRVQGHLSPQWSDWFEGFTITNSVDGEAVLSGMNLDPAALFGLLRKISNVRLPLRSVNRVENEEASHGTSDVEDSSLM